MHALMCPQVLAGPDQEILDIIVRYPGSYHDARIFRLSGLGIPFEGGRIRGVMLGDSGYPCETYLLTPVLTPRTDGEIRYNNAHKTTRNLVERTIGVWKQRFRCLSRGLHQKLDNSVAIICATSVLHNISRLVQDPLPEPLEPPGDDVEEQPFLMNERRGLVERRNFIARHFD